MGWAPSLPPCTSYSRRRIPLAPHRDLRRLSPVAAGWRTRSHVRDAVATAATRPPARPGGAIACHLLSSRDVGEGRLAGPDAGLPACCRRTPRRSSAHGTAVVPAMLRTGSVSGRVRIGTCANPADAALIRSVFAARGVGVVIGAEHHASLLGPIGGSFLSLDIWVARDEAEEAAALLRDLREGGPGEDAAGG